MVPREAQPYSSMWPKNRSPTHVSLYRVNKHANMCDKFVVGRLLAGHVTGGLVSDPKASMSLWLRLFAMFQGKTSSRTSRWQ